MGGSNQSKRHKNTEEEQEIKRKRERMKETMREIEMKNFIYDIKYYSKKLIAFILRAIYLIAFVLVAIYLISIFIKAVI